MTKIVYRITSGLNISFDHVVAELAPEELGYSEEEWSEMSEDEREDVIYDDDIIRDLLCNSVDIFAKEIRG